MSKSINKSMSKALMGKNNGRINSTNKINNENTAAWTEKNTHISNSNVNIPDTSSVREAKEWVDNGSRD